jgi:hypothetical protein
MATVDIRVIPVGGKFQAEVEVRGFAKQPEPVKFYRGLLRDNYSDATIDGANVIEMLRDKFPEFRQTVSGPVAGKQ